MKRRWKHIHSIATFFCIFHTFVAFCLNLKQIFFFFLIVVILAKLLWSNIFPHPLCEGPHSQSFSGQLSWQWFFVWLKDTLTGWVIEGRQSCVPGVCWRLTLARHFFYSYLFYLRHFRSVNNTQIKLLKTWSLDIETWFFFNYSFAALEVCSCGLSLSGCTPPNKAVTPDQLPAESLQPQDPPPSDTHLTCPSHQKEAAVGPQQW